MGISQIGIPGLVLIVFLALILFGPKKLPEMGKAFGETLKEFKKSTQDLTGSVVNEMKDTKEVVTAEPEKAEAVESTDNK